MVNYLSERQSNIELLRVVSMLLILVIHADFYSIPFSVPRWIIVEGADAGVNCFVLISGFFGIHPKIKSFSAFIFQIVFFIIIGNFIRMGMGEDITFGNFIASLNILNFSWFIQSYIALYAFAPVLNSFADHATRKQFRVFLVLWGLVEFFMGYTIDHLKFERGYSFQAFIFLYMMARYIKIHGGKWFTLRKEYDLAVYFGFTLATALIMFILENMGKGIGAQYYFRAYNSPLMIVASIGLLLFFSKLNIHMPVINWMGKSAYAAFLFHSSIYQFYRSTHHAFFVNNSIVLACVYSLFTIITVFFISILMDQIRIILWNRLTCLCNKVRSVG